MHVPPWTFLLGILKISESICFLCRISAQMARKCTFCLGDRKHIQCGVLNSKGPRCCRLRYRQLNALGFPCEPVAAPIPDATQQAKRRVVMWKSGSRALQCLDMWFIHHACPSYGQKTIPGALSAEKLFHLQSPAGNIYSYRVMDNWHLKVVTVKDIWDCENSV